MTTDSQGPLTEAVFYVLLAVHTPLHGYGIMQYVSGISDGRIALGPGTLYGALTTMAEKGWIRPLEGADGDRKKEYVITDAGRSVLSIELERLEELLRNGRRVAREGVR
jgi:DNA-binding PadR family transcriptional regulator